MSEPYNILRVLDALRKRSGLTATATLVAIEYAACAGVDGLAWPSSETVAQHTRLTARTVRRVRSDLVEAGWLVEVAPRGGARCFAVTIPESASAQGNPGRTHDPQRTDDPPGADTVSPGHTIPPRTQDPGGEDTGSGGADRVSSNSSINHPMNHPEEESAEQAHAPAGVGASPETLVLDLVEAPPDDPIVVRIPCNGGGPPDVPIRESQVRKWSSDYPAVDVRQTLRHIANWSQENPRKRKTPGGVGRFVTSWLQREQNKPKIAGPSLGGGHRPPPPRTQWKPAEGPKL